MSSSASSPGCHPFARSPARSRSAARPHPARFRHGGGFDPEVPGRIAQGKAESAGQPALRLVRGLCPGLNAVIRELVMMLHAYGVAG